VDNFSILQPNVSLHRADPAAPPPSRKAKTKPVTQHIVHVANVPETPPGTTLAVDAGMTASELLRLPNDCLGEVFKYIADLPDLYELAGALPPRYRGGGRRGFRFAPSTY
jgi:hypothetical protein